MEKPITVYDLALARGAVEVNGALSGDEFARLNLPMLGGCIVCYAAIAAYNACPSRSGYLKCASGCIGDDGYATVAELDADVDQNYGHGEDCACDICD